MLFRSVCQNCADNVKKSLEDVSGVSYAEVKLDKNWAEVYMDKNAPVSDEALRLVIEQFENYSVTGID